MGQKRILDWRKVPVNPAELCISTSLRCGQSFRWRKSAEDEWSCALHGRVLCVRQDSEYLHYRAIYPSARNSLLTPPSSDADPISQEDDDTLALVKHYFNLTPNLALLYEQWAAADKNFRKKAPKFAGVRMLRQDAWETLVGFICSSNNNIARISQMVEKLCLHYGPLIGHIGDHPYHDFPEPHALSRPGVEQNLRQLGFGYRAKYLYQTAVMVDQEKDVTWLDSLENPESPRLGVKPAPAGEMAEGGREGYRHAHEQLLSLQGVGPKVADCICLMGLGWSEAVPVDTHVWQIAQKDYGFGKGKHSSLTKATYDAVANRFRRLWGKEAGWAHSVLFTADLRAFSERSVAKVETEEASEKLKEEEGGIPSLEHIVDSKVVVDKRVKRGLEDEHQVLEVKDTTIRTRKRKRRAW